MKKIDTWLNRDRDKTPEKRLFSRHNVPEKLAIRQYCCPFRAHSCEKTARFQVRSSFVRRKIFLRRSLKTQEYCRMPRLFTKYQRNLVFQNRFLPIEGQPSFTIL